MILLSVTLAAVGVAALTGGGTGTASTAHLGAFAALLGLLGGAALISGRVRLGGEDRQAWAGVALLFCFGAWSLLSIGWSILPQGSWEAGNRALAYGSLALAALVGASMTPRAPRLAVLGITAIAVVVAVDAAAGKLLPGVSVGPLELDPGGRFSRISGSLQYWNALGLVCVMGSPGAIWVASRRESSSALRIGAALGLGLLVFATALSYSRGAAIGYAVVLAVMVGAGPRRLTRLGVGAGAFVALLPAVLVAYSRDDLANDGVALSARIDGGLVLAAVLLVCLSILGAGTLVAIRAERRVTWDAGRARSAWRAIGAIAAGALVVGLLAAAVGGGGVVNVISDQVESFSDSGTGQSNDPDRLLSANSSSRSEWWAEAVGAFSDAPLEGQGAGSFPTIHYLYRDADAPARSSHSLPLAFLSETGLVGFGLGVAALAALALAALRATRAARGTDRSARLALLAAFAAWLVLSLFDWHWEIPGVTGLALVAVAVASSRPAPQRGPGRAPLASRNGRFALVAAAALAALALATSAYLPQLGEQKRLEALSLVGSDPSAAAEAIEDARGLDPYSLDVLLTESSIASRRGEPLEAIAALQRATELEPDSRLAWRRLELAYLIYGLPVDAARARVQQLVTDPLTFQFNARAVAALLFTSEAPPPESPTAFGTPPPRR